MLEDWKKENENRRDRSAWFPESEQIEPGTGETGRQTRQARSVSPTFWVPSREICCFPGNLHHRQTMFATAWDDMAFTQWNYIPTKNPPRCFTGSGGEWIPVIFPLTTQQVTNALLSLVLCWSLAGSFMTVREALKDGGEDHRHWCISLICQRFPFAHSPPSSPSPTFSLIPTAPIQFPACLLISEWCGPPGLEAGKYTARWQL